MQLRIEHQESYSRAELLLRTFFGFFYIIIPHLFILMFLSIVQNILIFISWWAVLFTAKYPRSFFDFQVSIFQWTIRLAARIYNLSDGYPAFGMTVQDKYTELTIPYPETLSRSILLLRTFFGFIYVIIPHGFLLIFRAIGTFVLMFLAWWVVLFTGKYPKSWHEFNVGTVRWSMRLNLYMYFMTDEYPPFSGKANPGSDAATSQEPLDDPNSTEN